MPQVGREPTRKSVKKQLLQAKPLRTGGGGAWRAWVHVQAQGSSGLPDIAAIAATYHAAKAANSSAYLEARSLGGA
eukprot:7319919-Pyramimonas_sp.AAC.1